MNNPSQKYIAFEPEPYCIVFFKRLVELNKFKNSLIVPIGISNENKLAKLFSTSVTDSGSTFREDIGSKKICSVVPTFKLDDVSRHLDLKSVSLIKIDVEGLELEALKAMLSLIENNRPMIIGEILFRNAKESSENYLQRNQEFQNILAKFKYNIFQIYKTSDLKKIQKLEQISEFSNEIWNLKNKDLCDYVFIPKEKDEIQQRINSRF